MTELIIGIDGGGSRTRALLADLQGQILGRGEAGAANPQQNGLASAQQEILRAIERAFENAHLEKQLVTAACLGLAGIEWAAARRALQDWAPQAIAARSLFLNDSEIVIAAGTPDNWGIAVVAGTGSIAWGKARADGGKPRQATSGGWGYLIGDEGSAFELAREALRAAVQAADGRGQPTQLLTAFLNNWQLSNPQELIPRVYQTDSPNTLARLAPLVIAAAQQGDAVAQQLIARAGDSLALMVVAVARALQFDHTATPLALTGGLLLAAEPVRNALLCALKDKGYEFKPVQLVHEPALGAVRLALDLAQE